MDRGDNGRSFSYGAADPLDRAGAHIADRKHARHIRLERRGAAVRRCAGTGVAGQYESVRIAGHVAAFEPGRLGIPAHEHEDMANVVALFDPFRSSCQVTAYTFPSALP